MTAVRKPAVPLVDLNVLFGWDIRRIKAKLVKDGSCTAEEVEALEVQYKRYLAASMSRPDLRIPISVQVDKMWHQHILFTRDYAAMCEAACGRFVHHKPSETEAELARVEGEYLNNTLPLLRAMFGEADPAFWPVDGAICVCDSDPGD